MLREMITRQVPEMKAQLTAMMGKSREELEVSTRRQRVAGVVGYCTWLTFPLS